MKVLLKNDGALFAIEVVEASAKDEDFFDYSLPENTNILSLISAQMDRESEEDHINFEIFCKSKEQAESIVRELYLTGMADLTIYEKYTFVNLTDEITDEEWERINEIHKEFTSEKKTAHSMVKQDEEFKPDWERENREKYAWEE